MGEYISNNPDQFSEFDKLIKSTGKGSLLNTRGPFTLFLPTDGAMLDYYKQRNVNTLEDISDSEQAELILNHIVGASIPANEIGLGTLRETNALGDHLVTEFEGGDIMVNKHSKIIDRDILTANGYIHVIDRVMEPVTEDIFSLVSSDPSFKIFAEGLSLTGLKDTLQVISFPFGMKEARTRFTVLAVADTIYHRYGIYSVEDLIEWCCASPDSTTYLDNQFYRYMEYHCLNGCYYLSDLNTGIYPILSRDNNISFTIDTDYKINYDGDTDTYTGFIIPASNTPAKNGALHAVNDIMPVMEPVPISILFETTDFFDIRHSDYYLNNYMRFFDGENTFEKIRWEGDYLLYYKNNGAGSFLLNRDCLSMIGWWWISITFPKVMSGKYEVFIYQPNWYSLSDCEVQLDGVVTDYMYWGSEATTTDGGGLQKVADAYFPTTAEHTIRLRAISNGFLFWDYVEFVPVN